MPALERLASQLLRRRRKLARRAAADIARSLGALSRRWLDKGFRPRRQAQRRLVRSGFAPEAAARMLDGLFRELTAPKLLALLRAELGDPAVLDGFRGPLRRRRAAHGPGLIVHIFPSSMPQPAVQGVLFGLLLKSASLARVSTREPGILDLYLSSLTRHDPALAACCRIIRQDPAPAYPSAGLVTVWGEDRTLESVRARLPAKTAFDGYGHRLSFAWIARSALRRSSLHRLARRVALDVWSSDQRGCLSPVVAYVQEGGEVSPERFAESVAAAFERLGPGKPRDGLARAAAQRAAKDAQLLRGLRRGSGTRAWESAAAGAWIVLLDGDLHSVPGPSGCQSLHIKRFRRPDQVTSVLAAHARHLQAAAVEAAPSERAGLARALSGLGVTRVCRAGRMQVPPLLWEHDGRPRLAGWVRWSRLEP